MSEPSKEANDRIGDKTSGEWGMTTVTGRDKANEQFRKELQRRWRLMDPKDRVAVAELTQILLKNEGEDQSEVWDAYFEIVFPESVFDSLDQVETEDENARIRVDAYRKRVGETIRNLRQNRNMTQEQLAEATGLPQSHISRLECGIHTATHVTIERIAVALGTEPGKIDPGFE